MSSNMIFPNPKKIVCVTNRALCSNLEEQVGRICRAGIKRIILREKDLAEEEYTALAKRILTVCEENGAKLIIHNFPETARVLGISNLHLPLHKMTREITEEFGAVGCSVHSADEAKAAEEMGCSYITAGHIFATDCKKGVPPRGLEFLNAVCTSVNIPVYAIGGISPENMPLALKAGAEGVCIMSALMRI
ncbi:MAG: thiamine phosphate synthase [Oscillospiraceae bacterium]